ncbi:haloacid dehalogenase type II [soil metagenome]
MLAFTQYKALSFDCYGTLIDWESGIANAMRPILANHGIEATDAEVLSIFSEVESVIQRPPYKPYTEVLGRVADAYAERFDFNLTPGERNDFAHSVPNWPAFADATASLRSLGEHYDLVILSNVDDDLFAGSADVLDIEFDEVITAQQVGSYKPDPRNFEVLLERLVHPREAILHVAQSLFHDIAPANRIGLSTVWVNRRKGQEGSGATPPQDASPDLEVPDLATLARLVDEAYS